MFKSLESIASVVGIFMYMTISKFKQVLRSRKGLDYNTGKCVNTYHTLMKRAYNLQAESKRIQVNLTCPVITFAMCLQFTQFNIPGALLTTKYRWDVPCETEATGAKEATMGTS